MSTTTRFTAITTLAIATTALAAGTAMASPSVSEAPTTDTTTAVAGPTNPGPSAPLDRGAAIDSAVAKVGGDTASAMGDGAKIGSALGILIGCPAGALTGGTFSALVSLGSLTPLGLIGGCIIGTGLGGTLGSIGGAITGLPVLIQSGTEQYQKLQAGGYISAPLAPAGDSNQ